MEIERKFLVKRDGLFRTMVTSSTEIIQGYMDVKGATVRIRLRGDKAYLTIKGPSRDNGLSRYEFEKEITFDEALSLFALCEPGIVDKVRWLVPAGNHTFEVDEFFGDNAGLVVAEVELSRADEFFIKPDFIGKEVTGDRRYYSSQLRKNPFKNWNGQTASDGSAD